MPERRMGIWLGNAPVSWAVYEAGGSHPPYAAVLDAIAGAGYAGTELGPLGYFPTDPTLLGQELSSRHLKLGSSYLALPLEDAGARPQSLARAVQVARLLSTQGVEELVVGGEEHPERVGFAGRIDSAGAPRWSDRDWAEARATLEAVARTLHDAFRMRVVVHHHAGTFIETPDEVDRLLAETSPGEVDLLLDTGHCVYGGGDPIDVMRRHGPRVRYVHLKDMRPEELAGVRRAAVPYRRGVFCSPGEGTVKFGELLELLRRQRYHGWVIVEHDVVPDDLGRLVPDPFETARQTREYLRRELDL
jgi:inosose dehydratase